MPRILQIRRGTTAQNNNFTGLPGELSFDTETKTMRVHDGVRLGGYELARSDAIGGAAGPEAGNDFDIESVPAAFWANIVETYAPAPVHIAESALSSIGNVSYLESIFGIAAPAKFAQVLLVCQTPEAGYSVGDAVAAFGIGSRANPLPNHFSDAGGLHVRLMVGGENFWVSHHDTGATTTITNGKWKAKFVVWY